MIRKKYVHALLFCLMMAAFLLPTSSVRAANPTKKTLSTNTTYTKYDITGDKKADKILIKTTGDSSTGDGSGLAIYINGKKCFSFSDEYYFLDQVTAQLYTLKNGKNFLYLYTPENNGDSPVCAVLQYKSGKLKKVIDFNTTLQKYGYHCSGSVVKVDGNKMTVKFEIMSYTTAYTVLKYTYTYKDGTLKRSAKTTSVKVGYDSTSSTLTTAKSLKLYKSPTSESSCSTLKKGKKVKVTGAYVKSGKFCLKIKTSGKSYWIKCKKTYPSDGVCPFKE
ncbi:MAG: hypothetical protein LUC27_07950, partial [Lachnospiraceae bacterium]|nr:hypothetical protein [Lachnospiraceae bacterium]